MRNNGMRGWLTIGLLGTLATACTGVKFPNSGWENGRRTCGEECPGRVEQVRRFGGPAADAGRAVSVLSGGDLLLSGFVSGPATWTDAAGDHALCAGVERGALLARVAAGGDMRWAACAAQADAYGMAVLPDDGAVVAGDLEYSAVFAPGTPEEATLTATGRYDMFLARYDRDGRLTWVRSAGGEGGEGRTHAAAVAAAPDGSVTVTGAFTRHATFGAGESNELAVDSDTGDGIFVARYHDDGSLAWVRGLPATRTDEGSALVVLPDGGTIVAGHFGRTVTFDTVTLATVGDADAFLARFNPSGTVVWAVRAGGEGADSADALAVLPDGTLLVAGHFSGTATFGAGEPDEQRLVSAGDADVFLARYGADGKLLGVLQAGGRGFDAGFALAVNDDGGAVLAGVFAETARFGAGEPMETTLTAVGDDDMFLARFDPQGRLAWVTAAGGPGYDAIRGIALTSDGGVVATGGYGPSVVFGAGEKAETPLQSINDPQYSQEPSMVSDAFLVWFGP